MSDPVQALESLREQFEQDLANARTESDLRAVRDRFLSRKGGLVSALLKTLGFRRRQVRATVAWSATTLAVVGLLVGIPAGVWLGRLAWRAVADGLGVPAVVTVPALALLLTIPAAVLLVNVVGLVPARAAARTRPAVALRTE